MTVVYVITLLLVLAAAPGYASYTASESFYSYSTSNPYIVFDKDTTSNSKLYAYASYGGERYRLTMRAGSGTTKNVCEKGKGWLPNGEYTVEHMVKTWGNAVVQGHVWYLSDKKCSSTSSTVRTELFIHSSGIEGTPWTSSDYASNGCIKVSQLDRYKSGSASLRPFLRGAYYRDSETLSVRS